MQPTSTLNGDSHFQDNLLFPELGTASIDFSGKTLMIVEDVISNFQLLNAYLNKTGAQVIHVDNGLDAVNIIKNNIPVDLIIMDIRLPKMNGLEATALIKAMRKDIPIIAQTAFAMQADREKCLEAGCDDFIAKPFRKHELMKILSRFF